MRKSGANYIRNIIMEKGMDKPFFASIKPVITTAVVYGQTRIYTCAATSLRMVLEGKNISRTEDFIAQALKTNIDGAKIIDIPDALYNMRLDEIIISDAMPYIKFEDLSKLIGKGDTAIVSILDPVKGAHAVVVDSIKEGSVFIRDPLPLNVGSSYSVEISEFKKLFNKKAVIIK